MPKRDNFGLSRSSKKKGERLDRFLNWAIVIVVACILVVGGYLLISILNTPDHPTAGNKKVTHIKDSSSKNDTATNDTTKTKDDSTVTDDSNSDSSTQDGDTSDTSAQSDNSSTDSTGNYDTSGGGPDGPWHPIGTTQSEPHHTNYDMGSTDWNERVKAMAYATGIPEDQLVVKWLGNGGSADKSLGKVYSKQDRGKVYDVLMQWVTDKGWQPISVDVE